MIYSPENGLSLGGVKHKPWYRLPSTGPEVVRANLSAFACILHWVLAETSLVAGPAKQS